MFAQPGARGGDMLTRTTLTFGADLPSASVAPFVAALQRVPGVLLADWIPEHEHAVVAHDAAVPVAALIAAARSTGLQARVLAAPPSVAPATATAAAAPRFAARGLFEMAAVLLIAVAFTQTIFPRLAGNHLALPLLLTGAWAFVIIRALVRRSRP